MKQVKIYNKQNLQIFGANLEESEIPSWLDLIGEAKGKPERWVREGSESYESSDVLKTEMRQNLITGGVETWVFLRADYIIEIVDLSTDYNYLLSECYSNRKREYPPLEELANALFWKEQGDDSKYIEYMKKCEEVKTKYPKPVEIVNGN